MVLVWLLPGIVDEAVAEFGFTWEVHSGGALSLGHLPDQSVLVAPPFVQLQRLHQLRGASAITFI